MGDLLVGTSLECVYLLSALKGGMLRRITGGYIPSLQPGFQRCHPLSGRSMGPRLRRDVTLRLALDTVVTYRSRSVQALSDLLIRQLRQVAGFGGVVCPDAGQTVSLEFNLN